MCFRKTLVHCTAPALCEIKPACLFSVRTSDYLKCKEAIIESYQELRNAGKSLRIIRRSETCFLFFIYDEDKLQALISSPKEKEYIKSKGYNIEDGINSILKELSSRLKSSSFPHEIGLFLGYPLEDVIGFEKDGGRSSKYSGAWQVYGNVVKACRMMEEYKECSAICCQLLDEGISIEHIAKKYQAEHEKLRQAS